MSTTAATSASRPAYRTLRRRLLSRVTRIFNPLIARFAGTRAVPFFAKLHHRGRRSGRDYVTPVVALRLADYVVLPLAFGQEADWVRNLRAAGRANLRWRGMDWSLVDPVVISFEEGSRALNPVQRLFVPLLAIREFVRLTALLDAALS